MTENVFELICGLMFIVSVAGKGLKTDPDLVLWSFLFIHSPTSSCDAGKDYNGISFFHVSNVLQLSGL